MELNSSSNLTNYELLSLELQSLALLDRNFTPAVIIAIISFLGILTNALILVVIAKNKELHNKSQCVVFSHALTELLFAVFTFINNIRKIIYALLRMPDLITRRNCLVVLQPLTVSSKAALFAILILVIDRLMVVGTPIYYHKLRSTRYVLALNALCWGIVLAPVPFSFIGVDDSIIPICNYALVYQNSAFRAAEEMAALIVTVATILLYGLAIGIVSFRYWGKKWKTHAARSAWSRRIQLGAFRMMITVGCIYLICWGASQGISVALVRNASPITAAIYAPYIAAVQCMSVVSHLFVYYGLSTQFRMACKKLMSCKYQGHSDVTSVQPMNH